VVCKLTADRAGEAPSCMRVVGAGRVFAFPPQEGAAGEFDSLLHHASVSPISKDTHLKAVFFFDNE
jgi:hypothetical protein